MKISQTNAWTLEQFVARLGGVFEDSPWVAREAWKRIPSESVDALFRGMSDAVRDATEDQQLSLIHAHPELAGREAAQGGLSADSSSEQARLGFLDLDRSHFERIAELNRRYRQRFGFPCIVALKLHTSRASVMADMQRRLGNTPQAERAAALEQIGHIARGRIDKIFRDE
ncbi:MAG: 2-oxo-4-hydroxy-4-carboxy-5-ureidoimidazoline decarboxylase [Betaproteobacteria bacterium]|nr:2-oxo-4-hydroxy-4-carboxy-5-ureidoimidazoline decarboxylase [Betaproteobacteria bacterium]MSQ88816.1 2-oxo-4-hydroxy-4-carboxy-5-ureidoimidazoline decarboxylase [Betaproteobacteria bacterium]